MILQMINIITGLKNQQEASSILSSEGSICNDVSSFSDILSGDNFLNKKTVRKNIRTNLNKSTEKDNKFSNNILTKKYLLSDKTSLNSYSDNQILNINNNNNKQQSYNSYFSTLISKDLHEASFNKNIPNIKIYNNISNNSINNINNNITNRNIKPSNTIFKTNDSNNSNDFIPSINHKLNFIMDVNEMSSTSDLDSIIVTSFDEKHKHPRRAHSAINCGNLFNSNSTSCNEINGVNGINQIKSINSNFTHKQRAKQPQIFFPRNINNEDIHSEFKDQNNNTSYKESLNRNKEFDYSFIDKGDMQTEVNYSKEEKRINRFTGLYELNDCHNNFGVINSEYFDNSTHDNNIYFDSNTTYNNLNSRFKQPDSSRSYINSTTVLDKDNSLNIPNPISLEIQKKFNYTK